MADENYEDDIFDDLYVEVVQLCLPSCSPAHRLTDHFSYDDEPAAQSSVPAPAPAPVAAPLAEPAPAQLEASSLPPATTAQHDSHDVTPAWSGQVPTNEDSLMDSAGYNGGDIKPYGNAPIEDDNYGPINVKEDG